MSRLTLTAVLATSTALLSPAQAQDARLDPVILSAGLEPTTADRTGATVSVLTEEQIDATNEILLTDYLTRMAGVAIRTRGPIGTNTGFSIRGASEGDIAVFIDGINVADPSSTVVAFDFGSLTATDVSRVEVLKGSQSALYGSSAVAGVVSVTSLTATEPGLHHYVMGEYGSHNTGRLSYGITSKGERHDFAASLSRITTDGFSAADAANGNREADGYQATRFTANGGYTFDNGLRIGAAGFYQDSHGNYDASAYDAATGGYVPADEVPRGANTNDATTWGLRTFAEFETGALQNTLVFTRFDIDRTSNSAYGRSPYSGTRTGFSYQGGTDLGRDGRLAFGVETNKEDSSDDFGFAGSNRQTGYFAEVTWALTPDVDVSGTIRQDEHSRFGGHTTGRAALAWRIQPDLILRSSIGTGFRAPSNYQLFSDYGNPDLGPEDSVSADVGVEKRWGDDAMVRATLFHLDAKDMVYWNQSGTDCEAFANTGWTGCYAQAPGHSRRTGVELEAEAALTDTVSMTGAYTYTDSSTNATDGWARVPRHVIAASLTAEIMPGLTGIVTVENGSGRPDLPAYTVANATLSYDLTPDASLYLRVENLFDEHYQYVKGYGTSDRAFYVGLRAKF